MANQTEEQNYRDFLAHKEAQNFQDFLKSKQPPGLVDTVVSRSLPARAFGAGMGAVKGLANEFPTAAKVAGYSLAGAGTLLSPLEAIPAMAASYLADRFLPPGKKLSDVLPETSKTLNIDPSMRDAAALLAATGAGASVAPLGRAAQVAGTKGVLSNVFKNAPAPVSGTDADMVASIMNKDYLPIHEEATDHLIDTMLGLRNRGLNASKAAKDISDSQNLSISPEIIRGLNKFFPEHGKVQDLSSRLAASENGEITPDFVQTKPGYSTTEEIKNPGGVNQISPDQSDLLDQNYYANTDANSKQVPNFVAQPEQAPAPYSPEIQKPFEPELGGSSTNIPPSVQFNTTHTPPEGYYDIKPDSLYDLFSHANSNRNRAWIRNPITNQPLSRDPDFGKMMAGMRQSLRASTEPLSEDQVSMIRELNPSFEGTTQGDAVEALNNTTSGTIKAQQALKGPSIHDSSLSLMKKAYNNPDTVAFAQRLNRDYQLPQLGEFANKYGKSQDYAKQLTDYFNSTKNDSSLPDALNNFGKGVIYGGNVPVPTARLAGSLLNGTTGWQALENAGKAAQWRPPFTNNLYQSLQGVPNE